MSSMKSRPKYWRSLAELEGDPAFQEYVEREFRSPTEQQELDGRGRRRFMQLMGASFALAGCYPQEKLLPDTKRPDGVVPGVPRHFATVMDLAGAATGLLVKSLDGRPIKIEGNPKDSQTGGGTGAVHQAAVLGLYDPDRSRQVVQGKSPSTYKQFSAALLAGYAAAKRNSGAGFVVLSQASSSPTLVGLRDKLLAEMPFAKWVAYEALDTSGPREGAKLALGQPVTTLLHPALADVIVGIDSDLLAAQVVGGLGYSRAVASRRAVDTGPMSRIYAFETSVTELGSIADHRVSVRPSTVLAILSYLDAKVSAAKNEPGAQAAPAPEALGGAEAVKVLDAAVSDLLSAAGKGLVSVGAPHGPEAHALAHRLNIVLGNARATRSGDAAQAPSKGAPKKAAKKDEELPALPVTYLEPAAALAGGVDELAGLVAEMEGGRVHTLLILGANPAYDAPVDVNFSGALAKVKESFHLGLYVDETAALCTWHAPEAHFLEAWGDARSLDGSVRVAQPLIDPLLGGKSSIEVLSQLLGLAKTQGDALVRATHEFESEKAWRKAVHDGSFGKKSKEITPELRTLGAVLLPKAEGLEVVFEASSSLFDGRFANNAWLQELPHPLSKLSWGNAALVSPATAKEHGIKDGHLATVTVEGRSLALPALIAPGQADGVIVLSLGYGRKSAGVVGGYTTGDAQIVGANTYELRLAKAPFFVSSGAIATTGPRQDLAITQDLWAIDAIGKQGQKEREVILVRESTLSAYQKHPEAIEHAVHHPKLLNLWNGPVSYDGHKWGLAIDLNKCTGCSSCMIACQAENNVPVVGRHEVARGREMTWIRVERYYKGDENAATVRQQPVMCQHCDNAPCEQVCPVGATMHSPEGLNDMVYNRCIGTRYCSNNCPYKVRRFNYRNYNLDTIGITPYTPTKEPKAKLKAMVFNPDVTVRGRGVMEKCTFCVQRIQDVKIRSKNAQRPIVDGEIQVACEQACPTGAIVFGDLNDKKSRVAAAHGVPRAYELLQELNNRPRVNYLARISNPHPDLAPAEPAAAHHSPAEMKTHDVHSEH